MTRKSFAKMIKNDAQMESKWIQNRSKGWSKVDAKIDAKIDAKRHPQKEVGGRGGQPLSSTQSPYLVLVSQYHIPQCAVDSYINHQPNPQNGPSAPLRGCAAGSMGYRLVSGDLVMSLWFCVWVPGLHFLCVLCLWVLKVCADSVG